MKKTVFISSLRRWCFLFAVDLGAVVLCGKLSSEIFCSPCASVDLRLLGPRSHDLFSR
jgi:hypothetical protein